MRVPRAARQRGMLPLRAVSERAFTASRELDSILPKVYDNYLANSAGAPRAPTGAQAFARFKMQVGAA